MKGRGIRLALVAGIISLLASGCTWPWTRPDPKPTPPTPPPPTETPEPPVEPPPGENGDAPEPPEPPQPPVEPPPVSGIPTAAKVPGRDGFVFSPFNNKIIDVKGIPSGTLVADPQFPKEAKKYFRVP